MRKIILAILMLVTCFSAFTPVTYAESDKVGAVNTVPTSKIMTVEDVDKPIDVTADRNSKTMYYLSIPLNQKMYFNRYNLVDLTIRGDIFQSLQESTSIKNFYKIFEKSYIEKDMFTFVFTYTNVTFNNNPVITTWNIPIKNLKLEGSLFDMYPISFDMNITIDINIRSEYYSLFENADLSSISMTILYKGSGYPLYRYSHKKGWLFLSEKIYSPYFTFANIELKQREVPPDYDPIKEEGQAPDNGGIDLNPIDENPKSSVSLIDYIINAFKAVFSGTADIMQYVTVVVTCFVGLFFFGLIIKLLSWVFK